MLLAAQQTLPSRAWKAEPARRWAPEERREGAAGFITLPGVTEPGMRNGCCPPGRAGVPAHLPLPAQGRAVPAAPTWRSGVLSGQGGGRAGTRRRGRAVLLSGAGPEDSGAGGVRGRSAGSPAGAGGLPRSRGTWGTAPERSPHKRVIWSLLLPRFCSTWSPPRVSAVWEGARRDGYNRA